MAIIRQQRNRIRNEEPKEPSTKITKLAMRNRFNTDEKRAIYTAAESNVDIKIYLDDLSAATFIDLRRQDTINNVYMLEQSGLLGTGRADEIIYNPITEEEKYNGTE